MQMLEVVNTPERIDRVLPKVDGVQMLLGVHDLDDQRQIRRELQNAGGVQAPTCHFHR
jgi:hypothetical protein